MTLDHLKVVVWYGLVTIDDENGVQTMVIVGGVDAL